MKSTAKHDLEYLGAVSAFKRELEAAGEDNPAQALLACSRLTLVDLLPCQRAELSNLTVSLAARLAAQGAVAQNCTEVMTADEILLYEQHFLSRDSGQPVTFQQMFSKKEESVPAGFVSAREQLGLAKRESNEAGTADRSNPGSLRKKFVPPFKKEAEGKTSKTGESNGDRLRCLEQSLVQSIESEILDRSPSLGWDKIAGLQFAKKTVHEMIVWPLLRPDIFTGLRAPPKGLLLFGPPGTGKTLIGKAIASESGSTFFSISASSLTSKWVGEAEKLVKALFLLAVERQPSVVFIDEVDSLLSSRSDSEQQSSRRIKTEFLVQLDGTRSTADERILIVGATNRPQELDQAVRRRFVKRIYVPLPDRTGRRELLASLNGGTDFQLSEQEIQELVLDTRGFSGADLRNLCAEASLMPLREVEDIRTISSGTVKRAGLPQFRKALELVKRTVCEGDLKVYEQWNSQFGSFNFQNKD